MRLTLIGAPAELGDLVLHGDVAPEYVELPEYELPLGLFDTKPAIDWLTPEARVNCSRSSTLVRPLAVNVIYKHEIKLEMGKHEIRNI